MPAQVERLTITLDPEGRALAHELIDTKPDNWRVEILRPRRSSAQNRVLWPMLYDLSKQVRWYGHWLEPEEWKDIATASLKKSKVVPTFDGDGLVVLGLHTSEMADDEFSLLLELIQAFGAQQGVKWTAPKWMSEWAAEIRR